MSIAQQIADLLTTGAGAVENLADPGDISAPWNAPVRLVYGGTAQPRRRRLNGAAPQGDSLVQIVSVNRSADLCRAMTQAAIDALDGARIGGRVITVDDIADQEVEDETDSTPYRWSLTLSVRLIKPRERTQP